MPSAWLIIASLCCASCAWRLGDGRTDHPCEPVVTDPATPAAPAPSPTVGNPPVTPAAPAETVEPPRAPPPATLVRRPADAVFSDLDTLCKGLHERVEEASRSDNLAVVKGALAGITDMRQLMQEYVDAMTVAGKDPAETQQALEGIKVYKILRLSRTLMDRKSQLERP
jgi:hypothetical protein